MNNYISKTGGIMTTVLGEQPCPSWGKNPASHATISTRGGGSNFRTGVGSIGKSGRSGNFSVNFIGAGFCDG